MGSRFKGWDKKSTDNKKVRNATKIEVDGIKFDSKLEAYFYGLLKQLDIPFTMKEKIVLQEKFKYGSESIREIYMLPDFKILGLGYPIYVDTKGFQTNDNKIKVKMLKKKLFDRYENSEIHLPKNQKECNELASRLKSLTSH